MNAAITKFIIDYSDENKRIDLKAVKDIKLYVTVFVFKNSCIFTP